MSLKPIASTSFYPPILTKWNNEPVLQVYSDLHTITRSTTPNFCFAEPVIRWAQNNGAGATQPTTITWYGPEGYNTNPAAYRPLPQWGEQQSLLTAQLGTMLHHLFQSPICRDKQSLLTTALTIPSLQAVLTNGQGQFILCPWGWQAEEGQFLPFAATPLGLLAEPVPAAVPPPTPLAPPVQAQPLPDAEPTQAAQPQKDLPPLLPHSTTHVVLPPRHLPRWLRVSLSILVGLFFFWFAFVAGTLFLLRWVVGVHFDHPLSLATLTTFWHFWSATLHASPNAAQTLLGGATP